MKEAGIRKYGELQAQPSELVSGDGKGHILDRLSDKERKDFYRKLKMNLEEQLKYWENPIF